MTRNNLVDFIKSSQKRSLEDIGEYPLIGDVNIFVTHALPEELQISNIIAFLKKHVPVNFLKLVDVIYVGHMPEFDERNINAFTKDGALFITNKQSNEMDMIDDIVHEIAHIVEDNYNQIIYSDDEIEREFIRKREVLRRVLKYEGYSTDKFLFKKTEYDTEFDSFLTNTVGYLKLRVFSQNIFASPYAATSLREYFADGFEDYYLGKSRSLKNISPVLHSKLEELNNEIQNY
tara:strand:+ start:395 stop:1093 length:699 start_codon:yes stop_codon:yes gene_type:complete